MNVLFLIHPNHAIENWPSNQHKLKSYYNDVINYAHKFDGLVVTHLMDKSGIGVWENNPLWSMHDSFVDGIKSASDVIDYDYNKLGCTFGGEFDEILLKHKPKKILIGGGYYGLCVRQTYNELYKQYGSYIKELGTSIYKVPSLIFVPGPNSHRLSDDGLDEYQKEYVNKQSGRGKDNMEYKWEGMPDGESFEISESVEIILDGNKYVLEEGDTIFIEDKSSIPDRYKKMGFSKVGVKKKSNRSGKKWMVLAKKGDKYKVVHGGDSSMKDYTQHGSEDRRKKFWDRMGGKNSAKAKDPFSPLYWHKKFGTW